MNEHVKAYYVSLASDLNISLHDIHQYLAREARYSAYMQCVSHGVQPPFSFLDDVFPHGPAPERK